MKKTIAVLTVLVLLCAACAAFADMVIPTMADMPGVIIEDGETVVEEAAFEGTWVLNAAFDTEGYVDSEKLFNKYNFNYLIVDQKVDRYLYLSLIHDEDYKIIYESEDIVLFKSL